MQRRWIDGFVVATVGLIGLAGWLRPVAQAQVAGSICDVPAKFYYVAFNGHVVRSTPVHLDWIEAALNGSAPNYYKTVILGDEAQFRSGPQFIRFVAAVQEVLIRSSPWRP